MIWQSLTSDFYKFIEDNINKEPVSLRLNTNKKSSKFDLNFAVDQIECRQKSRNKLKSLISDPKFIFPDLISAEQASHEAVAFFHSNLITKSDKILDMTAGLGVDAIFLSRKGQNVIAIDINPQKIAVLKHNTKILNIPSLTPICEDSIEFLKNSIEEFDIIFIDPSRRGKSNQRLFNLKDCSPDVLENFNLIMNKTRRLLIKASPMLDLDQTLKDIPDISNLWIIGVKGETKEILIEVDSSRHNPKDIRLSAVNLDLNGKLLSDFSITKNTHERKGLNFAKIEDLNKGTYLLEPSAMVMKLAPWNELCVKFKASKLGKSSHLFISTQKPDCFPGRVTIIEKILTKKDHKELSGLPFSVISRNHPLSSDQLRKNLRIREGDQNFIYATRIGDKPIMLLAKP